MKYFPDITNYNMDTCAGKAQYLAHIEIEPIKLLIEHTQLSLNSSIRSLGECIQKYDRINLFKAVGVSVDTTYVDVLNGRSF